jgi:hypothetical protein
MFINVAPERPAELTLYTDAYVVRGTVRTRQHRVSDILERADESFLVLEEVVLEESGSRGDVIRTPFAQVNLAAVLFAVSDLPVEPVPELRTVKSREQALVTVPPFKLTGTIHLLPERELRESLLELTGRFIPMTDVTFWSDEIAYPRTTVAMAAVNHERAQILAPHRVVDPWAGLSSSDGDPMAAEGDAGT